MFYHKYFVSKNCKKWALITSTEQLFLIIIISLVFSALSIFAFGGIINLIVPSGEVAILNYSPYFGTLFLFFLIVVDYTVLKNNEKKLKWGLFGFTFIWLLFATALLLIKHESILIEHPKIFLEEPFLNPLPSWIFTFVFTFCYYGIRSLLSNFMKK